MIYKLKLLLLAQTQQYNKRLQLQLAHQYELYSLRDVLNWLRITKPTGPSHTFKLSFSLAEFLNQKRYSEDDLALAVSYLLFGQCLDSYIGVLTGLFKRAKFVQLLKDRSGWAVIDGRFRCYCFRDLDEAVDTFSVDGYTSLRVYNLHGRQISWHITF